MNSGMRFGIYPDEKQAEYFNNCFGCSRYVFNHFLEEWYLAEYTGEGYPCTYNSCSKEQRKLSRMQKGNRNYEKQRIRIARLHEMIAAKRNDFLHKESASLTDRYDTIFMNLHPHVRKFVL